MAPRVSAVFQFIKEALMNKKYPNLNWINRNEGTFCLNCKLKSKRDYNKEESKIFDDYHELKPRKSDDKRQRFLVAMGASPFIDYLDRISTNEIKYYKFSERAILNDEIAGLMSAEDVQLTIINNADEPGPPTVDAVNEIAMAMSTDEPIIPNESGPPTGCASVVDIANDLDNCSNPNLVDNSCKSDLDQLLHNLGVREMDPSIPMLADTKNLIPGFEAEELNGLSEEVLEIDSSTLMLANLDVSFLDDFVSAGRNGLIQQMPGISSEDSKKDSAVPDFAANYSETPENGVSMPFFNDYDLRNSFAGCSKTRDNLDQCDLNKDEQSYSFNSGGNEYPAGYDPTAELIKSLLIANSCEDNSIPSLAIPNESENVQVKAGTFGKAAKCKVSGVIKLSDSHDIVKRLQQNLAASEHSRKKQYYMMVLNAGPI